MESIEKVLKELKKDRRVNKEWIERLKKSGMPINYGKFSYWNHQEYIEIGHDKVWLVESCYQDNSEYLSYRYRNDVINEIYETIELEMKKLKSLEKKEEEFFSRLAKGEGI